MPTTHLANSVGSGFLEFANEDHKFKHLSVSEKDVNLNTLELRGSIQCGHHEKNEKSSHTMGDNIIYLSQI